METINHLKLRAPEQSEVERLREQSIPTMDSPIESDAATSDSRFTKEDFEAALRKVSRKIKPKHRA